MWVWNSRVRFWMPNNRYFCRHKVSEKSKQNENKMSTKFDFNRIRIASFFRIKFVQMKQKYRRHYCHNENAIFLKHKHHRVWSIIIVLKAAYCSWLPWSTHSHVLFGILLFASEIEVTISFRSQWIKIILNVMLELKENQRRHKLRRLFGLLLIIRRRPTLLYAYVFIVEYNWILRSQTSGRFFASTSAFNFLFVVEARRCHLSERLCQTINGEIRLSSIVARARIKFYYLFANEFQ